MKKIILIIIFIFLFAGVLVIFLKLVNRKDNESLNIGYNVTPIGSIENKQDFNQLFEFNLYSDKSSYKTKDKIKIWATLEYIGSDNQVTIWHSNPYISFTITDGKKFNIGGMSDLVLTSTTLEKNKLYEFDYVKSGAYLPNQADGEYWGKFYNEKDLYLPEGEYTVKVGGAFSLTEDIENSKSNLEKELKIKVQD